MSSRSGLPTEEEDKAQLILGLQADDGGEGGDPESYRYSDKEQNGENSQDESARPRGTAEREGDPSGIQETLDYMEEEIGKLESTESASRGGIDADAVVEPDESDLRSVYVGNVDYGSDPVQLREHFASCGAVTRVTILVDKYTGHPKGYAYIEFQDPESVQAATHLSDTEFRGRLLKVLPKRKNLPGIGGWRGAVAGAPRGDRGGFRSRGRGIVPAPRGRGGGFFVPRGAGLRGYGPRFRGRGFRARATPY
eukprot:GHVU01223500.1.p1 GENE.GHVU01223500.1~~GHVU01223500.1.p1  ORF type:complete len:252 (+),score=27.47 GHVU01223500.1:88-843(+)